MRAILGLLPFLLLVAGAAAFGATFQPGAWYEFLRKPPGNPPSWVFGPVWTALYVAIAVAAWRVWRVAPGPSPAIALWGAQLVLNAAWSWLFFGLERPGLALIDITALLGLLVATTAAFLAIDRTAGLLFTPYVAWVGYATYLNAGLWWLNR
jgi:tryptophan-rich sensory protein